ncbi:hypothetical protein BC829DRAFT_293649 [Chytridium lagenaria]|nr:hypothetical protein BC829DRAFT_293649 [Chytridium lagenaria]
MDYMDLCRPQQALQGSSLQGGFTRIMDSNLDSATFRLLLDRNHVNLGFAVTFLAFSGREDTTGEIVITAADMTISVAVFGVGFPLLRFLSSFCCEKCCYIRKTSPKEQDRRNDSEPHKVYFYCWMRFGTLLARFSSWMSETTSPATLSLRFSESSFK